MEGKSLIRFVTQSGIYGAVTPGVQGHLTDERAAEYVRSQTDLGPLLMISLGRTTTSAYLLKTIPV
jgi:hypothetical protein